MTTIEENEAIKAGLRKIRRKHRWLGWIIALYIPVVFLLYFLQFPQWLILGSAVFLICLGIVIAFIIGLAPCPDCGKPFHVQGMGGSIFTSSCLHCGISLKQG